MRFGQALAVRAGLVLAVSSASLGCGNPFFDDHCDGHGYDEDWCEQDQVMTCLQEDIWNHKEVLYSCMPGGCYKDPKTKTYGCRVPEYTCPAGVTGYQCLGNRRIECGADGVATDRGDCTWSAGPDAPELRCVANPGGKILPCGYTTEQCATPGEVRCMGNGTVVCRDSVWQTYVPSAAIGRSACDASTIRYTPCTVGTWAKDHTWCEGDEVTRCDECITYSDRQTSYERLCVAFTSLAKCQPGACVSHTDMAGDLASITGCQEPAAECTAEGQFVCRGDRPGYCSGPGVVALDRPCNEIRRTTHECQVNTQRGISTVTCQ